MVKDAFFRLFYDLKNLLKMRKIDEDLLHELYKKHLEKYKNLDNVEFDDFAEDAKAAQYKILDTLDRKQKCEEIQKFGEFLTQIENLYPHLMTKLAMTCEQFAKKLVF